MRVVRGHTRADGAGTICDQYVRVEDPLTMTMSGAGLGLYIVRELTELLGGRMTIESQVDVGTTVTIRLPLLSAVRSPAAVV